MVTAARNSLPAGISRAAGAGWERPHGPGGVCDKHSITGQFFDKKRGVAPSPDPDPDVHRSPSTIAPERTGIVLTGTSISTKKRGGPLTCVGKWLREWPR